MNAPAAFREVTLDDKYALERGRVYLSAIQALARLLMLQRERDARAGLDTAGFVSGYRGSPLGGLDVALGRAAQHLARHQVRFQPGLNEDLAATAVWGTQQVGLFSGARHDGVFAMWYGKAPGADRCGDVFRHGNAAGSSRHGGVLLVTGDDPAARSTTVADQTDHLYKALSIPVLAPASVQDVLDLGLHGFALSRFSGCWVALKCVADVVESSAAVELDPDRPAIRLPEDFAPPPGGLNIRYPDWMLEAEARLRHHKLFAALAYARANALVRVVLDAPRARLGIAAAGKAYADLRQAMRLLGIDAAAARDLGLRILKVDMPWPLEPEAVGRFADGLEEILVVEEKRTLVEEQLKEQLYHRPDGARPRVVGKRDGAGQWESGAEWLIPPTGELSGAIVARVLARRILRLRPAEAVRARLAALEAPAPAPAAAGAARTPWFCSGCPHNTSTRVPEGSRATAGIGCHSMAVWMDRNTSTWTHMGGEGAPWIGQAPFSETRHVFANLGDGTYFHSGHLAIRAAVAAKVPITYKILFNDAVAMTGGQPVDGELSVPAITRQMAAEGVGRIAVVSDEPWKYGGAAAFAPGTTVDDRDALDRVQRELRDWSIGRGAVSVLVYDQTCAAEKRRRRKRGAYPDPARRAFINAAVCEGCGDCSTASNCLSIEPLETELGVKRRVNQSACNKDFSCLKGFCPAFVTVEGGALRRGRAAAGAGGAWPALPEPARPALDAPYALLVTGVGGTGVVTIGALLGMAAHLEGKGVSVLDVTGLAQKGGAVTSHLRFADDPGALHAPRIGEGEADAVLACDLVVANGADARGRMRAGHTRLVGNSAVAPTADFTLRQTLNCAAEALEADLAGLLGADRAAFVPATRLATALLEDAIATNLFMLGFAYQRGLVPVGAAAIERAIELNAVAVEANRAAFEWGRRAAHDPARVEALAAPAEVAALADAPARDLDEIVARRSALLAEYQDAALAARYRALVARVRAAERPLGGTRLAEAVARSYAKLLAYKDEYEVARLYARPEFGAGVAAAFEGGYRLRFHFAPPLLARRDPATGVPRKIAYGPWMLPALRLLARLKFLRGTALDPFGWSAERRTERALVAEYEALVETLLAGLDADRHALAVELAAVPQSVRGFGHVKAAAIAAARARQAELLAAWRAPAAKAA